MPWTPREIPELELTRGTHLTGIGIYRDVYGEPECIEKGSMSKNSVYVTDLFQQQFKILSISWGDLLLATFHVL